MMHVELIGLGGHAVALLLLLSVLISVVCAYRCGVIAGQIKEMDERMEREDL